MPSLITEIGDDAATDLPQQRSAKALIAEVGDDGARKPPSPVSSGHDAPFLPWLQEKNDGSGATQSSGNGGLIAEFVGAATFNGAKPGYVFKLGGRGLGYYRDKGDIAAASDCKSASNLSAAKPAATATAKRVAAATDKKTLTYAVDRKGEHIVVGISLPGRSDTRGVVLAVMGTTAYSDLTLRVEGFDELRVRLPAVVDQKKVVAKFSRASHRLRVQLLVTAECGQEARRNGDSAAPTRRERRKKASADSPANAAPKLKEKVKLDDLKICSQCGGLGQYTDKQDIRCGLQGQKFSGLQRVLTYECPTCEGDGYINSKKVCAQGSAASTNSGSNVPGQVAKWDDIKKASARAVGESEWEMVDSAQSGDPTSVAQSDTAAYQAFKDKMDPAKRAEFEKILAEARSVDGPA